nr:unnamed protein product [Digitaria exilis]
MARLTVPMTLMLFAPFSCVKRTNNWCQQGTTASLHGKYNLQGIVLEGRGTAKCVTNGNMSSSTENSNLPHSTT